MCLLRKVGCVALALLIGAVACVREEVRTQAEPGSVLFRISCRAESDPVRSSFAGTEDAVGDWMLFVYYGGRLERTLFSGDGDELSLTAGQSYHLYALANVGRVAAPAEESSLGSWMLRPDNPATFRPQGLPMACDSVLVAPGTSGELILQMTRLVARYDFCIDKSAMQKSDFQLRSVVLRQAAAEVAAFAAASRAGLVADGDTASAADIQRLRAGYAVSFYMLENCQGVLLEGNDDPWRKVPDNIPARQAYCTYLELSGDWSAPGVQADLMYRMYLGRDNCRDFNVDRNTTSSLELRLTDEGVTRDSWKVRRTGIRDARVLHFDRDSLTVYRQRGYAAAGIVCDPAGVEYRTGADTARARALALSWYLDGNSVYVRADGTESGDERMMLYLHTWDGVCTDSLLVKVTDREPVLDHYSYGAPVLTLDYGLVPADGSPVPAQISYVQPRFAHYDNGTVTEADPVAGNIAPSATSGAAFVTSITGTPLAGGHVHAALGQDGTASVGGSHLGTQVVAERDIIRVTIDCSVNGVAGTASCTVRQQANSFITDWIESNERYDWQLEAYVDGYGTPEQPCPRAGGVVRLVTRASHMQVDYSCYVDVYTSGSRVERDHSYGIPYRYADYNNLSYTSGEKFGTFAQEGREEIDGVGYRYFSLTAPENTSGRIRQVVYSTVLQDGSFHRIDLRICQAAVDPEPDPGPDPGPEPVPVLVSISVSPASRTLAIGSAYSLTVTAHYSDGSSADVSSAATYTPDGNCVSVTSGGLVSGLSLGSATITASYGGQSASCSVEVVRPPLEGLSLDPASVQMSSDRYSYIHISPLPSTADLGETGDYSFSLDNDGIISYQALHDNGNGSFRLALHGSYFNGTGTAVISNGAGVSATLPLSNQVVVSSIGSAAGKGIPTVLNPVVDGEAGFTLAVDTPEDPEQWLLGGSDELIVQVRGTGLDVSWLFDVSFHYTPARYPIDDAGVTYITIRHSPDYPVKRNTAVTYTNASVVVTSRVRGASFTYPLQTLTTYYY